jgi:hypothetical protein
MLLRIAYVSRAAGHIGPAETYEIVRGAHNRNRRNGLTGALLFADGHFVQVIEGDPFNVRRRFERIAADPRHHAVTLRLEQPVHERLFADDWMALRLGTELQSGPAEAVCREFGYEPGLPAERFPGPRLVAFVAACCRAMAARAEGTPAQARA